MSVHASIREQGDDEDTGDYYAEIDRQISENPPPAPPGFVLIHCECEPRCWPQYAPEFYDDGPYCNRPYVASLRDRVAELEHAQHSRIWRTKLGRWLLGRAYTLGLIAGYGVEYSSLCTGCVISVSWHGNRPYRLGVSKESWRCLLIGHHLPGDQVGFGFCAKCLPCPDCDGTSFPCGCDPR